MPFKEEIMLRLSLTFFLYILLVLPVQAEETQNLLSMRLTKIPAGEFIMGTKDINAAVKTVPDSDASQFKDETPAHTVVFNHPFYMATTEITQAQWFEVMKNKPGPDENWQRKNWRDLPAVSISWFMADRFVNELNKMDKKYRYRLPSEAEWEYAARAGSTGEHPWSTKDLEDYAWFINNSGNKTQAVATKKPNAFGLYDMIGNAWEWTSDWYAPDSYVNRSENRSEKSKRINPQRAKNGTKRVRRGGSYHCPLRMTRVAYRAADNPNNSYSVLGFRVVATLR